MPKILRRFSFGARGKKKPGGRRYGDTLSRSYALSEADAGFSDFMRELKSAFEKYEQNGKVTIKYNAKCYLGKF